MTKESYREVVKEELKEQICKCCGNIFFKLVTHHKDGNKKNNHKKNLIVLCQRCHNLIHHGLGKKWFSFNKEKNNRILELRRILLMHKRGISKKKAQQILNYETWMLGQCWISPKTYCNLCKKRNNLIYYIPKPIKKLVPEHKQKTYAIVYCKSCLRKLLNEMKPYL